VNKNIFYFCHDNPNNPAHSTMKKRESIFILLIIALGISYFIPVYSQEGSDSKVDAGFDLYSNYIWRGSKFGSGPVIQPSIKYTGDWLTIGTWGSFDFTDYQEADLYFSFSLPRGFRLGMTDYYFPGLRYTDYSEVSGSHAFEITTEYAGRNFSLAASYIINKAGGAGSFGGDKYFEAGYTFKFFKIFFGAGDGWHTYDPETGRSRFAVCNMGLGASKTIKVSDSFIIPIVCQLIFNPEKDQMFLVAGFTL